MLKRVLLPILALALITGSVPAAEWSVDQAHSSVGFTVRHLVISRVSGTFHSFDGKINFDEAELARGEVEITVDMATIDTDNEKRDAHLKSPDFFEVEKFPKMTFKSTKVIPGEGGSFKLVGDLTIKDVTKEVTFDCQYHGTVVGPMGNNRAGFSAATTIDRRDFNVLFDAVTEAGSLVVGNEVEIEIEMQLIKG